VVVVRIIGFVIGPTVQLRIHCVMTLYFVLAIICQISIKLVNDVLWTAAVTQCTSAVACSASDKVGSIQLVLGALLECFLQRLVQLTFIIIILIMLMRNMLIVALLHLILLLLLIFHQLAELVQLIL
jgi:hypothetical protein